MMNMGWTHRRKRAMLLPLFLLLFISGCELLGDSKGPGDSLNPCSFRAELSGTVETPPLSGDARINGSAFVESTGYSILWIAMRTGLPNYGVREISLSVELDRSLTTRSYNLSTSSSHQVNWSGYFTMDGEEFQSTGGTVTVTAVEADRVAGAFEIIAENSVEDRATATGEFNAVRSNGTLYCADVIP